MMERAYFPWSEEDIETLLTGLSTGTDTVTLAELLERSPGAVRHRLALLHDTGIIDISRA